MHKHGYGLNERGTLDPCPMRDCWWNEGRDTDQEPENGETSA